MSDGDVRAELARAHALIDRLCAEISLTYPPGTRGHRAVMDRVRAPQIGDFVTVTGAIGHPAMMLHGWLRAVEPNENRYQVVYEIEHMDGSRTRWANVEVRAIPIGDRYSSDLLADPAAYFQSEACACVSDEGA